MTISVTQLILIFFLFFSLSRVWLRLRSGSVSRFGFVFWNIVFISGIIVTVVPDLSTRIAQELGVGRGVDAIIYTAIALLFYLVFRLHILIEDLKHDITRLISELALKELKKHEK